MKAEGEELNEYKIETGIPIPARRKAPGSVAKYPYRKLAIGQSFFVLPKEGESLSRLQQRLLGSRNVELKPLKFTTRIIPEENGVRVWRVE